MLFDNPIFAGWYTDTVDVYRVSPVHQGNVTTQKRQKVNGEPIPCRIYSIQKDGPSITDNAARERATEKLACELSADIRAGDELQIIRGGNIGMENQAERYLAGNPTAYYDPVGGALTGLQHKEIGLLKDDIIK